MTGQSPSAPRSEPSPSEPPADPRRPPWAVLHVWQIQWVRDLLVGLGLLGLLAVGHAARIVTIPLLIAILFAYLLEPVVVRLTRGGRVRRRAAVSALLVLLAIGVVVPALLGAGFGAVQGARLAGEVAARVGAVAESVEHRDDPELLEAVGGGAWRSIRDFIVEVRLEAEGLERGEPEPAVAADDDDLEHLSTILGVDSRDMARALDSVLDWVRANAQALGGQAITTGAGAVTAALSTLGSVARLAFGAFLAGFFFYFVSSRWEAVKAFARGLLPVRNRERAVEIATKMDHAISGFVRGRLTIAFVLSIFYTIGFALIGVPAPLVMGPCLAVLAIFPYATLLGLPFVVLFLWLEPHEGVRGAFWWAIVMPIVVYQIGQLLDDYVLTPAIQGDATGLDTPTILFASVAGAALLGFFGMLVAIPLAACIKILVTEVFWPRFRAWSEGKERDFLPIEDD